MKKIISLLAVMALLCTSVFAAGTAVLNDTSYEDIVLFEETFEGNKLNNSKSFNVDSKSKEVLTYEDGVAVIAVDPEKTPSDTSRPGYRSAVFAAEGYYRPTGDILGVQFDIGFENLGDYEAGTELVSTPFGTAAIKTPGSWHFGNNYPSFDVLEVGEEGAKEKKLFFGDVEVDTTKMNTVEFYLNFATHDLVAYIDGTKLEKTYTFGENFTEFNKIDFSVADTGIEDVILKVDNIKVTDNPSKESSVHFVMADNTLEVDNEGNVSFGAILPENFGTAKAYINDIEMDVAINEVSGAEHNSYVITAAIPEGVAFGDATLKLVADENSVTKEVKITKMVEIEVGKLTSTKTDGSEQKMALANQLEGGKYRIHFDFAVTSASSFKLGIRLCPDTSVGNGAWFGNVTSGGRGTQNSAWAYWSAAKLTGNGALLYTDGSLNSLDFIVDYHGPNDGNRPYQIVLNGKLALEGTYTLADSATYNGFKQFGYNSTGSSEPKNIVIYEQFGYPAANSVKAYYASGLSLDYTDESVTSVDLSKIEYTFDQELSNTDGNIKFTDDEGVEVEGAQVSANGNVVTVEYKGEAVLASGTYKLVIGKNVIAKEEALGAAVEAPIEFSTDDTIIYPLSDSKEDSNVKLKAYVKDADKVLFYINEKLVEEFEPVVGGIYEKDIEFAENGTKVFDVYTIKGDKANLLTNSFKVANDLKYNIVNGNADGEYADNAYIFPTANIMHTGRVCIEGKITLPATNSKMYFELGRNKSNFVSTTPADGWGQIDDALGYQDTKYIFNEDGTIYTSDKKYEANKPYAIKYVLDFNQNKTELYIDGEYIETRNAVASKTGMNDCEFLYFKIRHKGSTVTYSDLVVYCEATKPEIEDVKVGEASIKSDAGYVVSEDTTALTVSLTAPYEDVNSDIISVYADGEKIEAEVNYNKDAKTIELSNLALKAGQIIEIKISADAQVAVPSATKSAEVDEATQLYTIAIGTSPEKVGTIENEIIYALNQNMLSVTPMKSYRNGSKAIAYTKYFNGGEEKQGSMLLGTWAAANRYSSVDFKGVTFEANKSGLVSISGEVGAKWNANLWDASYAPIAESIGE